MLQRCGSCVVIDELAMMWYGKRNGQEPKIVDGLGGSFSHLWLFYTSLRSYKMEIIIVLTVFVFVGALVYISSQAMKH